MTQAIFSNAGTWPLVFFISADS